jgi:catechol 2,3-dioxygenase-like lactoylglutathione lyase family enzyme
MVSRIGHVGIQVPDLDRSIAFAERILGLRVAERSADCAYLTCNARHHELVLIEGNSVACDHLAFEVHSREMLDELTERVEAAKLPFVGAGQLEAGIEHAVRFLAPGGFTIELFHGMARGEPAAYDSIAPRPIKFEHITVKSSHKDEFEDVLIRVLGMRLSDRAEDAISWLRASDEHHGISVIAADVDQLHHYAWQIDSFGVFRDVGDHLMNHGRSFLWGPGHHGIGDNYFCYFKDEDGAVVEYSASIQRIEDESTYQPRIWPDEPLSVNRWGNPPPPPEFAQAGIPLVSHALTAGGLS